ncbi:hypothetical protein HN51_057578 [Arachis hypogaea]
MRVLRVKGLKCSLSSWLLWLVIVISTEGFFDNSDGYWTLTSTNQLDAYHLLRDHIHLPRNKDKVLKDHPIVSITPSRIRFFPELKRA